MILFLLLILIEKLFGFTTPQNILCSNKKATDFLIYQICSSDKFCSQLYNLPFSEKLNIYIPDDFDQSLTFQNFNYIIKQTGLSYPLLVTSYLTLVEKSNIKKTIIINQVNLENGLYYKIWSSSWRRSLIRLNYLEIESNQESSYHYKQYSNLIISENRFIEYNTTQNFYFENLVNFNQNFQRCLYVENITQYSNNLTNTSDYLYNNFFIKDPNEFSNFLIQSDNINILEDTNIKSSNLILSILYILTIYKEHISMNETCNDVNERLYFDIDSSLLRCVCLEGKNCDAESQDINTVLWITLLGIIVVILTCFVVIYSSITILTREKKYKIK